MRAHGARDSGAAHQRDRGSSAIELAVFTPVMLLVIMATVQFALIYNARHIALSAAREGNRVGRSQDGTPSKARTQTQAMIDKLGPKLFAGTPKVSASQTQTSSTVTVDADVLTVLPFPLPAGLKTVHETVAGPKERFCPPGSRDCGG